MTLNPYADDISEPLAAPDGHRNIIGGLWKEMGIRQRDYLLANGLKPTDKLIDIGCGSLRAGVVLVPVLDPGNYYGIDYLEVLIEKGYECEIRPLGLEARLPRANLAEERAFSIPFEGVIFDVALAQSVFTHLPLNHLRLCLARLRPRLRLDGVFHCTVFVAPDEHPVDQPMRHPPFDEIETFSWQDPFHVWRRDIEFAMTGLGWRLEAVEDWDHPRGQKMARFRAI